MNDLFHQDIHADPTPPRTGDAWQSIGDLASVVMSEAAMQRKLDMISKLGLGEVDGWKSELRRGTRRPFPGETTALALRERQLGRA